MCRFDWYATNQECTGIFLFSTILGRCVKKHLLALCGKQEVQSARKRVKNSIQVCGDYYIHIFACSILEILSHPRCKTQFVCYSRIMLYSNYYSLLRLFLFQKKGDGKNGINHEESELEKEFYHLMNESLIRNQQSSQKNCFVF